MYDYHALLNRAIKNLPEKKTTDVRFVIPEPKIYIEGKTTILDNFSNIIDVLNRDSDHVMKFLTREFGTASKMDGGRAIFQGRFPKDLMASTIKSYTEEYVMCSECNRPDTQLVKSDRVLILKCSACGAHRPVKKRRITDTAVRDAVEEGKEYEDDIVYFYLEIDSVQSISTIKIENKVLLKEFDDQQNVIKLNINDKKNTFYLKNGQYFNTVSY